MAFENGTISFRLFHLVRHLPEDYVERFAEHAAPPADIGGGEESCGWVTGRHLLDRNITEESAHVGGYLRLDLCTIERKPPASLVRAECRMEEQAVMAADGKPFLKTAEKTEIRKQVQQRLEAQTPPTLRGIPLLHRPETAFVYAAALSKQQSDIITARWLSTLGFNIMPCDADYLAFQRFHTDTRSWQPTSFSPRFPNESMEHGPGRDFLTWLLYKACTSGSVDLPGEGALGVLVEGPLLFCHEGKGAHEILLRKGEPVNSAEASTALLAGKKLKQAKISFTVGDQAWSAMFQADEFTIRNLRLPDVDTQLDTISYFQERMMFLERFSEMLLAVYGQFTALRNSGSSWGPERQAMVEWVKGRQ